MKRLRVALVIVVVGLVGLTYYLYDQSKSDDTLSKPSPTAQVTAASRTHNWFVYQAPHNHYSIKLPDGWNLVAAYDDSAPYAIDAKNVVYKPNLKATVNTTTFAGDISHVAFAMSDAPDGFFGYEPRGSKKQTFKTMQGLTVSRYDYRFTTDSGDIPKGTIRYDYRVIRKSTKLQVVHDVLPGETTQTSLIKDTLQTLTIN